MNSIWKVGLGTVAVVLVMGMVFTVSRFPTAQGQAGGAASGVAKHTVVATDGTHLVVTDNAADVLYFYAIEKDGKPGDELKLRGSFNLAEVGKPSIKPTSPK